MVGRSVGRRGVRWRRALSDGGRRTDGSFYFFLEPPSFEQKREKRISHDCKPKSVIPLRLKLKAQPKQTKATQAVSR